MPICNWALILGLVSSVGSPSVYGLPWYLDVFHGMTGSREEEVTNGKDQPEVSEGQSDPTKESSQSGIPFEGIAHVWGYSVLHFDFRSWIGSSWFSTPTAPGTLSSSGGWGLYFLDQLGVWTCGDFWPWVARCLLSAIVVLGATLILYLLLVICRPCQAFCKCCCRQTRAVAKEVGELLPELRPGGTYEKLDIRGPASSGGVDSEFYQRGVKGRGSERKPNDVAVVVNDQIARLKVDGDHWARVDRYGLWVRLRGVKGSTSKALRQTLEQEGKIHLCREQRCPLELQPTPGLHCKAYASVDANGLVDLGAYAGWSTRRVIVLMGRWLRRMVRGLSLCVYYLTGWFILRQLWAKRTPPRTIVEGAVVRPLDAESESEVEVQDDPCEAVLVGLEANREHWPQTHVQIGLSESRSGSWRGTENSLTSKGDPPSGFATIIGSSTWRHVQAENAACWLATNRLMVPNREFPSASTT